MTPDSWLTVHGHYRAKVAADPAWSPMADLAGFLAASRYAASLSPRIEDDMLLITRRGGADELRIRFDPARQEFELTHAKAPDDPSPWSRECAAGEWHAVLERLLHMRLRWFHEG